MEDQVTLATSPGASVGADDDEKTESGDDHAGGGRMRSHSSSESEQSSSSRSILKLQPPRLPGLSLSRTTSYVDPATYLFKMSASKKVTALVGIATNLQVHSVTAERMEGYAGAGGDSAERAAGKGGGHRRRRTVVNPQRYSYSSITVGAPAAHAFGFKYVGGRGWM